jgi:hypothetical protein
MLISFGQLPAEASESMHYPHGTQFLSTERSDLLTLGFRHPHTLVDAAGFFEERPAFRVHREPGQFEGDRLVLYIGLETDKRLLLLPLSLALLLSGVTSVVFTVCTKDVATGAQVGGTVGSCIAVLFAYVCWRLG